MIRGSAAFVPMVLVLGAAMPLSATSARGLKQGPAKITRCRRIGVAGTGSTLVGNIVDGNSAVGLRVGCPSNLADNTIIGNGTNLAPNGAGCRNTDNVIP